MIINFKLTVELQNINFVVLLNLVPLFLINKNDTLNDSCWYM